ncbi:MAG: hypothetical protein U0271_35405 [Polyangiaceae bacterium]
MVRLIVMALLVPAPLALARIWLFSPRWVPAVLGVVIAGIGIAVLRSERPNSWRAVLPLASVLGGGATSLFAYGTVAFDNPTNKDVVFVVDETREIRLAPGKHEVTSLPVGNRKFQAAIDDERVDDFSGDVEMNGEHLATPLSKSCYGLFETVYGALSSADSHGDEGLDGQQFYTLEHVDYYFEDPPSSVSSKKSGEARRSLKRAICSH